MSHFDISILFSAVMFLSLSSFAEVEIYTLRPNRSHFQYVIPVRAGHRAIDELNAYKSKINSNEDLRRLLTTDQVNQLTGGQTARLKNDHEEKVLILANRGYDYEGFAAEAGENRIRKVIEKLSPDTKIYVLPIAAVINLNTEDRLNFYEKLSNEFAGVIALGGADVTPEMYEAEQRESRDTNKTRDLYELDFLKYWIQSGKGFLYGICRGHQIIAVALGLSLEQHIENHGDSNGFRNWTKHRIKMLVTRANHFRHIFGFHTKSLKVNSYHHQAVVYKPHNFIDLAAVAEDGMAEALESVDGRILTTQFHPEFMDEAVSKKLFNYLKNQARLMNPKQCIRLFK